MRKLMAFSALCLPSACAFPPGATYVSPQDFTTGSNLPRKGQADAVDKSVVTDTLRRGSQGIPTTGGGG